MSIFVFELGKLPKEIDKSNLLELFLRLFSARTEEDMENIEKLGVDEMTQMVKAYRDIVKTPEYLDLELRRLLARYDEEQALLHATKVATEVADKKWKVVVAEKEAALADKVAALAAALADKEAALADKEAIIAELKARKGKDK
jgi:capsular polysaccharide biosynthesis protein